MNVYETKTCGKLYLAGEYAVVLNKPAVLVPINKYLVVRLFESNNYYLKTNSGYMILDLEKHTKDTIYITKTINWFNLYLNELRINEKYFTIEISSELYDDDIKYGFGSSGAVTIGLLKAMFMFYNLDYNCNVLYKAGVMIQLKISKYSSYGDLACIAYEKAIFYRKFNDSMLEYISKEPIKKMLEINWEGLIIQELNYNFDFLIVYTNKKANSYGLVKEVMKYSNNQEFHYFLNQSEKIVSELKNNPSKIYSYIDELYKNYNILDKITSGILITKEMIDIKKIINEYHGVMKPSGAGGGDSVICFFEKKSDLILAQKKLNECGYITIQYSTVEVKDESKR